MENGAPDLSKLRSVDPETAAKALVAAEMANGLRCHNCGQRIEDGWHVFLLSAVHGEKGIAVQTRRVAICIRPDCMAYHDVAVEDATYEVPVQFVWYTEDPAAR